MFDFSRTIFRRTRQIGIDRLTEFFFVLIFFLFPWYSSGRVLISRGGLFLWSCENQIFLMRCWEFLSQRFLKASRRILEVLNFWSKRKSNFRLCETVLLDRCQTFCYNSFWGFLLTFSNFSSKGIFLKRQLVELRETNFPGVVPPLFPWNCLGQFPGWVCLARHLMRLIFGFFNFSFFAHAKDEMRKLTRRAQTRPMRFFFNQRGLVRDRGWLLPLGRSPSVRILDLFLRHPKYDEIDNRTEVLRSQGLTLLLRRRCPVTGILRTPSTGSWTATQTPKTTVQNQ